jgi:hypothetical protein
LILDDLSLPSSLIEMHWLDDQGWEEHINNNETKITDINNIDHYLHTVERYRTQYTATHEDQLPAQNLELVNFIRDSLIHLTVMKNSDEWEDFRIATNRA